MKYPILVIIPSRNRPASVPECIASFTTNGNGLADYFVVERRSEYGMQRTLNSVSLELVSQYEVVAIINDDVRMRTKNWDTLIFGLLNGRTGLVYGRDGIQDQKLATQPFMSAAAVVQVGFLGPPHGFLCLNDNFWWEIFGAIGRIRYVPELFTEHLHTTIGKSPMDETYRVGLDALPSDLGRWPDYVAHNLPEMIRRIKVLP